MSRLVAAIVSVGLVAAALEPVVRKPDDDGFPLSTFPMFAAPRPSRLAMSYAVGVARDGRPRTLSPEHLGTGEVMQAFAMLQRGIDGSAGGRAALCAAIAARVARDAAYRDVVAIRLVSATHDAVAYLADGTVGAQAERARCDVPGAGPTPSGGMPGPGGAAGSSRATP
jgi:hypothetical protein